MITLTNIPDKDKTTLDTFNLNVKDCYRFWNHDKQNIYHKLSWLDKELITTDIDVNSWFECKHISTDYKTLRNFKVNSSNQNFNFS
jgi:hypothetical protein